MKKILVMCMAITLVTACKKNDKVQNPATAPAPQVTDYSKMTLEEFSKMKSPAERDFILNTHVTDKSHAAIGMHRTASLVAWPRVTFKWHGLGAGGGCDEPLGLCIILSANDANPSNANLYFTADGGGLVIEPTTSDNGLDASGKLAVSMDINVDTDDANDLGYASITIKAGIYQATYDTSLGRYVYTVVDYSGTPL